MVYHRDVYLKMLDILRLYQRKGQFISSAYGSELTTSEAFILVELAVDPTRSATDLSKILNLNKSTISRLLNKLIEQRYLAVSIAPGDKRRKQLKIAPKGQEFLELHDQFNNRFISQFAAHISIEEQSKLQHYLKNFADGDGAAPLRLRSTENPLLIEMRRLARSHGITTSSFMGSGYSSTQWQILSEIYFAEEDVRAKDLCNKLHIIPNTMSQILSHFEELGLVEKHSTKDDKRSYILKLTGKGVKELTTVEQACKERIKNALSTLSIKELNAFVDIFGRYTGIGEPPNSIAIYEGAIVRRILSEEERFNARAFVILSYVRTNTFLKASETIVGINSYTFGLFNHAKLTGIIEFQPHEGGWQLENFCTAAELENHNVETEFVKVVLKDVLINYKLKKISVMPENSVVPLLEKLSFKIKKGKKLEIDARALSLLN